jgi:anti-sigma factor RsiW
MALAASLLLVLGAGGGWWARSQWPGGPAASAPTPIAALPAYVQDAAIAHAVFTPEQRHPVEVGAGEQAHLLQWLSRRLGTPLQARISAPRALRWWAAACCPPGRARPRRRPAPSSCTRTTRAPG